MPFGGKDVSLQHQTTKDEAIHPTPPSVAMGQERIRVRTGFFQHQSAEARILLAYTRGICIILSDIKFHLLLQ